MRTNLRPLNESSSEMNVTSGPRAVAVVDPRKAAGKAVWTGRVMSGLSIAFLLFDGIIKVIRLAPVVTGTAELGYPTSTIVPVGLTLLACVALYAIPRTAVLGAVLLTGYFGGAIATHVRVGHPLFSHVLFPVYVAALVWGGLALRQARVRAIAPWRPARG